MYKNKYLKYKSKYLELKEKLSGGSQGGLSKEANRVYQATRAYANAPVFPEHDERHKTHEYALTHLAQTITKKPILHNIGSFLDGADLGRLSQTRKVIGNELREDAIAKAIHQQCFSRIPFESMVKAKGDRTWTGYLPELVNDRSHKILIMGGSINTQFSTNPQFSTNRVDMMIINDGNIEWKMCAPMIKNRENLTYSAYYCQGQVLSVDGDMDGRYSSERYDVLSQTAVEHEHMQPTTNVHRVAIVELDGKAFAIGGVYRDAARQFVFSDRVSSLDMSQAGAWIEEARLITGRSGAAAATYQGKVWVAGGYGNGQALSSVEVFDPVVGLWQAAGDLTKARYGRIALFAIKDDLFAAGSNFDGMYVEKRDMQTGAWQLVSELNDCIRTDCALAACGSTIYFFGGFNFFVKKTWDSFDTHTSMWASQQEQYRDVSTRQLPREFCNGQAVCITPDEQLAVLSEYAEQLPPPEP
jgi:hypothetical protein